VDEDLLVLLEPAVHGVPVEADEAAELFDGRLGVVPRGVLGLPVAALDREVVGVSPTRRVTSATARREELHADVVAREVVGGVVRDLPDQLRLERVGDELAAQVGPDPLRPVFDAHSVSWAWVRHLRLRGRRGLATSR
jgi:hypothetical protein